MEIEYDEKERPALAGYGAKTPSSDAFAIDHKSPALRIHCLDRDARPSAEGWRWSNIAYRIGRSALVTLLITSATILGVVGFLFFLWFAGPENSAWYSIAINDWATRAVSIPSMVLRTATDLQTGIVVAMLAALALECGSVTLQNAAKISLARSSRARATDLIAPVIKGRQLRRGRVIGIIVCLIFSTGTTLLLQFSSTLLLSDLRLGPLPSLTTRGQSAYDFAYHLSDPLYRLKGGWEIFNKVAFDIQYRSSAWTRNPAAFPAFAEYAEPAIPQDEDVDDTGVLLRAFLPFSTANARETLCNYTGNAMVLDSRVACQRPMLRNLDMHGQLKGFLAEDLTLIAELSGDFAPSLTTDRMFTPPQRFISFKCGFAIFNQTLSICTVSIPSEVTEGPIRQTNGSFPYFARSNRAGGLLSEFANTTDTSILTEWYQDPDAYITWGTPLLVLNFSTAIWSTDVLNGIYRQDSDRKLLNYSMLHDKSLRIEEDGIWSRVVSHISPVNMSISLCYTAWDTASLPIKAFAASNRTEPILHWQEDTGYYTEPSLSQQLGSSRGTAVDHTSRGILSLEKKESWIPPESLARPIQTMPFVQLFGIMGSILTSGAQAMVGNWSAIWSFSDDWNLRQGVLVQLLWYNSEQDKGFPQNVVAPDGTLSFVFESAYRNSGSLARAVASLITTLSQMAYYDSVPNFTKASETEQSFFTTVLYPQRQRGLWTVLAFLALHLMLVALVTLAFARWSRYSRLGRPWHSVAQLYSYETKHVFTSEHVDSDSDRIRVADFNDIRLDRKTVCLGESLRSRRIALVRSVSHDG